MVRNDAVNRHIQKGNDALATGDHVRAAEEYALALSDPDEYVRRIAQNRLADLHPKRVYGSIHSHLYHKETCGAQNVTYNRNMKWFRDWSAAEQERRVPCPRCKPRAPRGTRLGCR